MLDIVHIRKLIGLIALGANFPEAIFRGHLLNNKIL